MNKYQNVSFRSIDDFLTYLPDSELKIVEVLREMIFDAIPDCKEKLSYNVPFYSRYRRICFLWPSSVPWGGVDEGVALGFCRAHEMMLQDDFLQFGNKQQVAAATITDLKMINGDKIRTLLYEATIVDEQFAKTNKNPQG